MSQVFKMYLSLFLLLLIVFTLIGIITADMDISNARDYKNYVMEQIESSNFSDTVIESCKEEAKRYGYTLETNLIKNDIGITTAVEFKINYPYSIKLLNVVATHELIGYVR